jgi:hypothetical protein
MVKIPPQNSDACKKAHGAKDPTPPEPSTTHDSKTMLLPKQHWYGSVKEGPINFTAKSGDSVLVVWYTPCFTYYSDDFFLQPYFKYYLSGGLEVSE